MSCHAICQSAVENSSGHAGRSGITLLRPAVPASPPAARLFEPLWQTTESIDDTYTVVESVI
jgi:hypothetical protein